MTMTCSLNPGARNPFRSTPRINLSNLFDETIRQVLIFNTCRINPSNTLVRSILPVNCSSISLLHAPPPSHAQRLPSCSPSHDTLARSRQAQPLHLLNRSPAPRMGIQPTLLHPIQTTHLQTTLLPHPLPPRSPSHGALAQSRQAQPLHLLNRCPAQASPLPSSLAPLILASPLLLRCPYQY
jgi:hypothetical protein